MTGFATYLETLAATAKAASTAEQQHQKEAARRAAVLKVGREFAWRRLNLMRAIDAAIRDAEDEETAAAAGRAAMLREVGWNGGTQAQCDVADRFAAVVRTVWTAARAAADADPAAALADFEAWFAAERKAPFLGLMEREITELPLVEV